MCDDLDASDLNIQEDIEIALLQMRTETLTRVEQALVRLDAGNYGSCFECGLEISERRLRALPFAVRCQPCEARREETEGRSRQLARQSGNFLLFQDVLSS